MSIPTLSVTLLGAGQEVGRSCCVLQHQGKTVVCDVGLHLAHSGMAALPFIDELDWSTVDALLIAHFHLDHAGALPYITEKTNFRDGNGKVYMTHPTKALHKFMMQDFLVTPCPGISFTGPGYHAGHVLGACMFLVDIAGLKILYTGDYSREEDRHLVKAELPPIRPDVLIVESTFGVHNLQGRAEQELRFTTLVHSIMRLGGHVLLPTFALEFWKNHSELHETPIYYASGLASKSMAVYQTYIHTMNSDIKSRFNGRDNPFIFKYISNLHQPRGWEKKIAEGPPCVILASTAFMQSGPSRELFELWAPDSRNGLIITGSSVEGTLARDIMNEPDEVESTRGGMVQRKITVAEITFSAHVDFSQNAEFIEATKAQHVKTAMSRLRVALTSRYKEKDENVQIHSPRNLETLEFSFRGERIAKAIGTLANRQPRAKDVLSGLLVSKDFSYTLLDPRDLKDFGVSTCTLTQRQKVVLGVRWQLIRWHLEGLFGSFDEGFDQNGVPTIRVMRAVDVKQTGEYELTLEWESNASSDMLADSTLALIAGIDKSPASVKVTAQRHSESHFHPHADQQDTVVKRLAWFLEAHFGEVELHMPDQSDEESEKNEGDLGPSILVRRDEATACIDLKSLATLKKGVESVFDMVVTTTSSLGQAFVSKLDRQGVVHSAVQAADV
ncbi:beta-lactamase-like protein [Mycena maculata]|uniref:Beta-lactamase-like protein n=1 Tax=Mycena maculata TaxID=230809 RepID=A0AAD7HQ87_9AGAR|nr:beta-lactamase-like protein [Mycena maculata]